MTAQAANPLMDLLDRLETEAGSPSGVPDEVFSVIAQKFGDRNFVLPDQAAWDGVQQKLEAFEVGEDESLAAGAVEVLAAAANRQSPLLANDRASHTPQVRAVQALGIAFKSASQYVQLQATKALGKYGSSLLGYAVPTFAAAELRKGFKAEDHFVKDDVLAAFARVAAHMPELPDLEAQIDGLEKGLRNPNSAHAVAKYLERIAMRGPKHAAVAIHVVDRVLLAPKLDSEVYDEGIQALSKIGLLDEDSARRAIAAIGNFNPLWRAGRDGRAEMPRALADIALAYPSTASQAIDVLFAGLEKYFDDNDAAVQFAAVDAAVAIAVQLPAHEAGIRSRLRKIGHDAYGDVKEMTDRALDGIEPAREALRIQQELIAMSYALGSGGAPSP